MLINHGQGPRIKQIDRHTLGGVGTHRGIGGTDKAGPRFLGMGSNPGLSKADQKARFVGAINSLQNTPTYNIPTIDNVTWHFDGPLTDAAIQATFGSSINLLTSGTPQGVVQIDTTFAQPGEFQTFALICGIQWRLDVEPVDFTAPVNLWTSPASGAAKPVSPDVFSVADLAVNGPLGMLAGQTMIPGQFEFGWWITQAAFHMFRGYNLQWQYGHNYNIINDTLRNTAFLSSSGDAVASDSEIDIDYYLRKTNDYYRDVLKSPLTALAVDSIRLGNMTLPPGEGGVAGMSVFKPSRAYERVGATYGGGAAKTLVKGNSEFRRLSSPFLAWPGVPIGIKAQVSNDDDQIQMQKWLSATYGFGGNAPASFTEDINVNVGNSVAELSGQTSQEPSLDNPSAPQFIQRLAQRAPVKGGSWKLTVAFKGYELTPDQAALVQNPDMRTAIQSECGCGMGPAGAAT